MKFFKYLHIYLEQATGQLSKQQLVVRLLVLQGVSGGAPVTSATEERTFNARMIKS
jgi:hypothetical protein